MAGRMAEPCWRPFSVYTSDCEDIVPRPRRLTFYRQPIIYTGPFRNSLANHSPLHGLDCAMNCGESDIFVRSRHGIRGCEVLFALFEDLEAYGTLVEVGMAHALGKRIVIGLREPPDYGNDDPDHIDSHDAVFRCNTVEELCQLAASIPSRHLSEDIWFAMECAEQVFCGNTVGELLRQFSGWLKTEYGGD
jgi:hypothetical protein